jgi:hypothetical protein
MTYTTRMALRFAIAAIVGAGCLVVSEKAVLFQQGSLTTSADARVGRPLTPVSYAGVARRTTRRAVTYGAAGVPVVAAPRCVQAVNANGRIYTRCY